MVLKLVPEAVRGQGLRARRKRLRRKGHARAHDRVGRREGKKIQIFGFFSFFFFSAPRLTREEKKIMKKNQNSSFFLRRRKKKKQSHPSQVRFPCCARFFFFFRTIKPTLSGVNKTSSLPLSAMSKVQPPELKKLMDKRLSGARNGGVDDDDDGPISSFLSFSFSFRYSRRSFSRSVRASRAALRCCAFRERAVIAKNERKQRPQDKTKTILFLPLISSLILF